MWKIVLACAIMIGSASTNQQKRFIDNNKSDRNSAPDYGFVDPFQFHQTLTQQIMAQHNQQNKAFSSAFSTNGASAFAAASNAPEFDEFFQEQFSQQQKFFENLHRQSGAAAFGPGAASSSASGFGFGSASASGPGQRTQSGSSSSASGFGFGSASGPGQGTQSGSSSSASGFGFGSASGPGQGTQSGSKYGSGTRSASGSSSGHHAPNYASASGSFGPGGGHQTASIFPENPDAPNINTRFSDDGENGGGGFHGVSVSSYSSSSDVNGKKTNHRGASTTINDNGKVTTYRVHS